MSLEDTQESSKADDQETQLSDLPKIGAKADSKMEKSPQNTQEFDSVDNFKQETETPRAQKSEIEENTDQNLYDEILEKLDIKKKEKTEENNQEIQEKLNKENYLNKIKNLEVSQTKDHLEKVLSQDFIKIQKLVKEGLINSAQGQNLKKQVLKKAFDKLVQTEKIKRTLSTSIKQDIPIFNNENNGFEEFSKNNPDFFTSDGRKEVLNYLKSGNANLGKDELNNISMIIRTVEKAAIDRYLQKVAHEKTLKNSNESAKQRLTANAQKSSFSGNLSKTFTREQIGKMSGAEFAKYESAIMEQLKKGHIR